MQTPYFPDWRGVHHSEHLPQILCTSRNLFSGYIPVIIMAFYIESTSFKCYLITVSLLKIQVLVMDDWKIHAIQWLFHSQKVMVLHGWFEDPY